MLLLAQTPLYFMYSGAPPDWNVLTRILLSLFGCAFLIAFLVGFWNILRHADPTLDWVATTALCAGLVYVTGVLVSQSLEAGTVIVSEVPVDPTVDGPLAPGQFLLYGATGRTMTALFLVASGFAVSRTRLLHSWVGATAYLLAAANLAFVPSVFFGSDAADFYSAVGWGATAFAASFLMFWVLAVGIAILRLAGVEGNATMPAPEPEHGRAPEHTPVAGRTRASAAVTPR
ncbi:hypothetical protein CC117_22455 [Parafrankia colletiae]|uniref:Uncharacterized protein n=1 Tax=Parafrankia colletiae TaxID=573497 RepID=A0A1S1QH12_9ACTN|nr:hypothetical protein CC117_22455 [Parafrankia colletiae]